jgi:hypothetical protein
VSCHALTLNIFTLIVFFSFDSCRIILPKSLWMVQSSVLVQQQTFTENLLFQLLKPGETVILALCSLFYVFFCLFDVYIYNHYCIEDTLWHLTKSLQYLCSLLGDRDRLINNMTVPWQNAMT